METGAQAASAARLRRTRESRTFYILAAVSAAAIVFVGFARTYYLKELFGTPALPLLVHIHGLLMTSWLALLIGQTTLVAAHRTHIHRRLGIAGAVLAIAITACGISVAIHSARRGHAPTGVPPLAFLSIPLADISLFSAFVGAALYYRRRPELHKRLMLLGTISILPAGIARWPSSFIFHQPLRFFLVADALLICCIVFDYVKTRRLSPAYLWGGLLIIASHPLRVIIAKTAAWTAFAHFITGV